jgi:hypothetical protein
MFQNYNCNGNISSVIIACNTHIHTTKNPSRDGHIALHITHDVPVIFASWRNMLI